MLIPGLLALFLNPTSVAGPAATPIIHGGEVVDACAWPSVVATVLDDQSGSWGSGSLVHPRVVVYSAHSGTDFAYVFVGDDIHGAGRQVAIERCVAHPDWVGEIELGKDIAYCLLAESVDDVPVVPILMGCEVEEGLSVGAPIVQVGFGQSEVGRAADGKKRWLATGELGSVDGVELPVNTVGDGTTLIGDSGGPPLIQLADGSWRVFGVLSHGDGVSNHYVPIHQHVEWLEGELAADSIDLTPCHELDGTWSPGAACGAFPLSPGVGSGSWEAGCIPGELSGLSETCGEPHGDGDGDGDGDGGDDGDGESGSSSGTDSTSETGDESAGETNADQSVSACACRSHEPARGTSALALCLLASLRRRRV